jgi:hypothetical protein
LLRYLRHIEEKVEIQDPLLLNSKRGRGRERCLHDKGSAALTVGADPDVPYSFFSAFNTMSASVVSMPRSVSMKPCTFSARGRGRKRKRIRDKQGKKERKRGERQESLRFDI